MKTKLYLILPAFILFSSQAFAQKNVIKLNPLSLIASNLSMFYERTVTEHMSFQLGANYINWATIDNGSINNATFQHKNLLSGFGFTPELRFYLSVPEKTIPRGVFLGPYFKYMNMKYSTDYSDSQDPSMNDRQELQIIAMQFGAVGGYQFLFKDKFALDIFGGPNYQISETKETQSFRYARNFFGINPLEGVYGSTSGIKFRLGVGLGYAF